MNFKIVFLFIMLHNMVFAQKGELALQNQKGKKRYFSYGNEMVLKLKDGKFTSYPKIYFKPNQEKIITSKLVFHSLDSFYFKDKFAIAYQDIEWFYQWDFFSYTKKVLATEFIIGGFFIAALTRSGDNYLLGFPVVLLGFPLIRKLEKAVFYTNDWKLFVPMRKNFYYKHLDKNPSLIFSK